MLRLSPNWYAGQLPVEFWPDAPCEYTCFQHNLLPLLAGQSNTTELPVSKKFDAIIFGASGLVTDTAGQFISQPRGGTGAMKLVKLANPAGNEIFTSDFVPWENIFGCYSGMGTAGGVIDAPASLPVIWPSPIVIRRGGSLLITIVNLNTVGDNDIRVTFYGLLVFHPSTRAAA